MKVKGMDMAYGSLSITYGEGQGRPQTYFLSDWLSQDPPSGKTGKEPFFK